VTERIDPDCKQGKCRACPGWTVDPDTDDIVDCAHGCHENRTVKR
jgi:hypothetical protein